MSESAETRYTADELVAEWAKNMIKDARESQGDDEHRYEERRGFYENAPSLGKYRALMAYLGCYALRTEDFISADEELDAWRRTFGLADADTSREALKAVLDDHVQAMAKAHNAEVSAFFEDITL